MKVLSREDIKNLLHQLQTQRNQIDERLTALETMDKWLEEMEKQEGPSTNPPALKAVSPAEMAFRSLSLRGTCMTIVRASDELWTARQVTERAETGGYPFKTNRPETSVATTLRRLADEEEIRIIRSNRGVFFRRGGERERPD